MDAVDTAFAAVPRSGFLPPADRDRADFDGPVLIGHGQTNSQPRTVAAMLRLLEVGIGMRVLDVGAGSGWTTALLAELTGPGGRVVGVERVPALAQWGASNVRAAGYPHATVVEAAEGVLGLPAEAPYDRILVSADAPAVPGVLLDQLAEPGRMVLPVRSTMTLVRRHDGRDELSQHGGYRFVPLVG
ncbi:protein-L-isoaspartate O-methyltransferase family protein [Nocardioides terrisoli]|uniref:protein-L-isoaspartate O-methyltransferase family protein n=1 Tax=Nocardioides terrisoli TaxID=3388267 RepID=UPI00287BC65E|nr:protein-L-isoaspartate O-methyltransferase [Nocardioides marmorisolisilvae]